MRLDYEVYDRNYRGPLEGLLEVARSGDVPLSEIKLVELVEDFINFLQNSPNWKVGGASSLLVVFSELLRIKTRELLPEEEEEEPEEEEEIRVEKEFFLKVGETLKQKARQRAKLYEPDPELPEFVRSGQTVYKEVTLFELIKAFQDVIVTRKKGEKRPEFDFSDEFSTDEQMDKIRGEIDPGRPVEFDKLLSSRPGREEVVVTFIALLQLVKQNVLRIVKRMDNERIFVIANRESGDGSR